VRELVRDVAVLTARVAQWAHNDDLAIVDFEGRRREGERLKALQLFKLRSVYELTRVNDRDSEVAGQITRVKAIVRCEA